MSAVLEAQLAVIPYFRERDSFPKGMIHGIYRKLVEQGIDQQLLHNGTMDEAEFVRFADEEALSFIFLDLNGQCAGIAWLTNVEETETLRKALGAFAFFTEYQKPEFTEPFGKMFLGQCFNILDFSLIYGITPEPNRAARLYCKRLGFEYCATIPGFVSYGGQTVNAMVATMTRDQFNSKG